MLRLCPRPVRQSGVLRAVRLPKRQPGSARTAIASVGDAWKCTSGHLWSARQWVLERVTDVALALLLGALLELALRHLCPRFLCDSLARA